MRIFLTHFLDMTVNKVVKTVQSTVIFGSPDPLDQLQLITIHVCCLQRIIDAEDRHQK